MATFFSALRGCTTSSCLYSCLPMGVGAELTRHALALSCFDLTWFEPGAGIEKNDEKGFWLRMTNSYHLEWAVVLYITLIAGAACASFPENSVAFQTWMEIKNHWTMLNIYILNSCGRKRYFCELYFSHAKFGIGNQTFASSRTMLCWMVDLFCLHSNIWRQIDRPWPIDMFVLGNKPPMFGRGCQCTVSV